MENNSSENTLHWIMFMLLPMTISIFIMMLIAFPPIAAAGIIGDIADLGFKVALIRHWKAFLGVILLLAGAYAIAHKPIFRFKFMAITASITLWVITLWGGSLLLGEFWNSIESAVSGAAIFLRRLF